MVDGTMADQQLIIHAFAPIDGPDAELAYAQVREIWTRCRELLGITEPIAGLPDALPPDLAAATAEPAVAALEDSAALHQMILRRVHDVLNFSIVFTAAEETAYRRRRIGSASPPGWIEFDRWWDELAASGTTALLGLVRLYLAAVNDGPASPLDAAAEVRAAMPPAETNTFWWDRGQIHLNEFALWEVSPDHDARPERRIAIIGPTGRDPQLSVWTWSNGGPAIPPLARYLMHAAKVRYEARVWGRDGQAVDQLRRRVDGRVSALRRALAESAPISAQLAAARRLQVEQANLATAIKDVREMRRTTKIAKANMANALVRPLRSDISLAEWLTQALDDATEYLRCAQGAASELGRIARQMWRAAGHGRRGLGGRRRSTHRGLDVRARSPEEDPEHPRPTRARAAVTAGLEDRDTFSTTRDPSRGTRRTGARTAMRVGLGVEIVEYGARAAQARDDAQDRLAAMVESVLDRLDVRLDETDHTGTGDGLRVFLPPDVEVRRALPRLVQTWQDRLASDNQRHHDRLRLRIAFGAAPFGVAAIGLASHIGVEIDRLLSSDVLRRVTTDHPDVDLAMLVSSQLHEQVTEASPLALARFRQVHAEATDFSAPAWLLVPGPARPTGVVAGTPESTEEPRRRAGGRTGNGLRVLAVADEWLPARGGLSAFNRYLCGALVAAGAEVYCVVPDVSEPAKVDASRAGVYLIAAKQTPGMSGRLALALRPALPGAATPDIVIGHGRVTGPMAKSLAEQFYPDAVRLHFVHMDPNQIEWHRLERGQDAADMAEEHSRLELALGQGRNVRPVAVGPTLHKWLERDLFAHRVSPIRFDPGFDGLGPGFGEPPGIPLILLMGRVDDRLKGVDIAARAIGYAMRELSPHTAKWEVLLRGTPAGQGQKIHDSVEKLIGHRSVTVNAYNYASDFVRIDEDLRRASVLLMPSRVEAFGLVGMEAIGAGTPVLVSDRSGLGVLLQEMLPSALTNRVVVPVADEVERDTSRWGHRLAAVLDDRTAAFSTAQEVRKVMVREQTWAGAVDRLLAALGLKRTP